MSYASSPRASSRLAAGSPQAGRTSTRDLAVSRQRADTRAQLGLEVLHDLRIGRERIAGTAQAEALVLLDRPVEVQERDVAGLPPAQPGGERDELREIIALETDQRPERPRVSRRRRREPGLPRLVARDDDHGHARRSHGPLGDTPQHPAIDRRATAGPHHDQARAVAARVLDDAGVRVPKSESAGRTTTLAVRAASAATWLSRSRASCRRAASNVAASVASCLAVARRLGQRRGRDRYGRPRGARSPAPTRGHSPPRAKNPWRRRSDRVTRHRSWDPPPVSNSNGRSNLRPAGTRGRVGRRRKLCVDTRAGARDLRVL